jgi:L-methionine (R)-S-oxide reductase
MTDHTHLDDFDAYRARMNERVLASGHLGIKRFWALDTQAYHDGALDGKTKELLGLVASMVLRCDDCITYHIKQCAALDVTRAEFFDAFNVALVVGGSIVIPHLRRAVERMESLIGTEDPPQPTKAETYALLAKQLESVFEHERDFTANMANTAALLFHTLPDLNWAGFYLHKPDGDLLLGPFQGKIACVRIGMGKGVCGTAAQRRETVIVPNVHEFPGHIACDSASNSEIVLPVIHEGRLLGVLDLDSPTFNRFDDEDARGLQTLVEVFLRLTDVPQGVAL